MIGVSDGYLLLGGGLIEDLEKQMRYQPTLSATAGTSVSDMNYFSISKAQSHSSRKLSVFSERAY